ncbi:MAG: twin-arginine translocation signal domain-containing protein [Atopobiaceae bacterium]|jgi:ribose transport system substrate-binding protein|nr:twin-arginine translocation signal domain-containing protein [Atopobiaceae bacterium]MCH4180296.1 twin-arginine translocation signal domain-containing protein [Atopobiaceae bacterium]MCH4214894.1 twin-arginine translocation signal domain-containing protein [Atopobiaceae bacterium]MCH4229331.1 twin-arginine translocation signal domain-containing protein [Atopobiaceae bacterium]MCH4276386.1 twin-arginine translocation signal domain-containing protein [Atopobiaceae bacterium]
MNGKKNLSRRDFLRLSGVTAAGIGGATLLAGCSSGSSSSADTSASSSSSSSSSSVKIGVSIWSSTDALGKLSVDIIKKAADILGVEISTVDQGHVSEQVTASVETLCAAGCNGIVICNSADSEMTSCINTCDQNEVYLGQFYRIINQDNSPDVYKLAQNSKYYVGAVHENEVENGEKLVSLLTADNADAAGTLQKGARNIKLEGWTVGDATFQQRWNGYKNGVDTWNSANPNDKVTLSDPVYANTSSIEGANVTQQFYNTDPTMDALIVAGGGGDPLVGSVGQLANMGLTGKIRVASTDFLDDLKTQLSTGGMYCESGGHFCDPLYSFLMVYQACQGKITPTAGDFGKEIKFPYVYVSSVSEYEDYEKYFVDEAPYTDDEIKKLADMSFDDLNKSATELSIDDVKSRHSA